MFRLVPLTICIAASSMLFAGGLAPRGAAQTDQVPRASTMSGVYSTTQAARGEERYFSLCVSCHPPGTIHSDPAFTLMWAGRPLSDLYDAIKEKMPKNEPGTLTPEESAQLVAYLLKMNGLPAGKTELPDDIEALKKIRIETPSMPAGKNDRQ